MLNWTQVIILHRTGFSRYGLNTADRHIVRLFWSCESSLFSSVNILQSCYTMLYSILLLS
jgi:hypothetical protein